LKHWQEMAQILDRVVRLGNEGKTSAVAIVTEIHGSAYRRAGAKLFVEDEDGAACIGGVSGGCLEEDVRQIALDVRREGRSRVLHYDTGDDDTKLWGWASAATVRSISSCCPSPSRRRWGRGRARARCSTATRRFRSRRSPRTAPRAGS
jgi:hypothetical protein